MPSKAEILSRDPTNLKLMWKKAQKIYKELKVTGLSDIVIAGILGNMAQESSFNPKAKSGIHTGYIQNQPEFVKWITQYFGGYDHKHQMNYLIAGLTNKLPDIKSSTGVQLYNRFTAFLSGAKKVKSVADATTLWEDAYEISHGQEIQARINYANYFYKQIQQLTNNKKPTKTSTRLNKSKSLPDWSNPDFSKVTQSIKNPYYDFTSENTELDYPTYNLDNVKTEFDLPVYASNFKKGGKLIKRGQQGMQVFRNPNNPYDIEIQLEKDPLPEDYTEPNNIGKYGYIDIPIETRMDQTTQQLNKLVSTYQPTKELQQASQGIKHPFNWWEAVPALVPLAAPAIVSSPYWAPAAATTLTSPTFWTGVATKTIPNLIKDTGTYIAADTGSQLLTGKSLGDHINNLIDLEEGHPVGEILSFSITNPTRKLISETIKPKSTGSKITNGIEKALEEFYPIQTISEEVTPYGTKVIQNNGKIRFRLASHTDQFPREIVLDPQGNNQFYVHIRTWNGEKVPANLSQEEINTLYNALYDELPVGAEILIPQSGPDNYATRGTIAALKRISRDSRFMHGKKGKVFYEDNGKIRKFKTTSFIKKGKPDWEYINRQLIPLAKQQDNWQGSNGIINNIEDNTIWRNLKGAPFWGEFDWGEILINTDQDPIFIPTTYLHEIRHAFDYSTKFNNVSWKNPLLKYLRTKPTNIFKKGTLRPIQLTKEQIQLLNKAYPTKWTNRLPFVNRTGYQRPEKIAANAEIRYLFDKLYFKTFGTHPTVEQLNTFINILPDDKFIETILSSRSAYIGTYLKNIVKPLPKEGTFNVYIPSEGIPLEIQVNKHMLGHPSLQLMRKAITSVPSLTGIGYGLYSTQQSQ